MGVGARLVWMPDERKEVRIAVLDMGMLRGWCVVFCGSR